MQLSEASGLKAVSRCQVRLRDGENSSHGGLSVWVQPNLDWRKEKGWQPREHSLPRVLEGVGSFSGNVKAPAVRVIVLCSARFLQ